MYVDSSGGDSKLGRGFECGILCVVLRTSNGLIPLTLFYGLAEIVGQFVKAQFIVCLVVWFAFRFLLNRKACDTVYWLCGVKYRDKGVMSGCGAI